ncbi:MAG: hypothetical protein ACOX6Z_07620 [Dethiobacteria bacterium]|jgi:hypothetical protein
MIRNSNPHFSPDGKIGCFPGLFLQALFFLLVAGLAVWAGLGGRQQPGNGLLFHDLAAFRAARLSQPELREPFCPGVLPEILFAPGPPPGYRLMQSRRFDLDGDGVLEKYILQKGILTVYVDSRLLWQSPAHWWVDYFFFGDVNDDGLPELNLSVWKEGSFGPRKPFWLQTEDSSVKNHLFIYKLAGECFKPVWQSSNLDCPNYWAALVNFGSDGGNQLAALEGRYDNPLIRKTTFWQWNGWGFSRTDRRDVPYRGRYFTFTKCIAGRLLKQQLNLFP